MANVMLQTSPNEDPVAIQLGGSDPGTMGEAAYLAERTGNFCEVNGMLLPPLFG